MNYYFIWKCSLVDNFFLLNERKHIRRSLHSIPKKKKVPPFQSQESRTIQLTFFYFNFFFKMTINYYNSVTYAITQKNEAALDFLKSYFKEYDWFNIDMQLFN